MKFLKDIIAPLFFFTIFFPIPVLAVSFVDVGNDISTVFGTTIAPTLTIAGTDTELVCFIRMGKGGGGESVVSANWNTSESLTQLTTITASPDTNEVQEVWFLTSPSSGTHSVNIVSTATTRLMGQCIAYENVNPITPLGTYGNDTASSNTATKTITTTYDNSLVIGSVAIDNNPTPDGGQTERNENDDGGGSGTWQNLSELQTTTAGNYTLTWSATSAQWIVSVLELHDDGLGGGGGGGATTTATSTPLTYDENIFLFCVILFFISLMAWGVIFSPRRVLH